jgi:hypothetical protein
MKYSIETTEPRVRSYLIRAISIEPIDFAVRQVEQLCRTGLRRDDVPELLQCPSKLPHGMVQISHCRRVHAEWDKRDGYHVLLIIVVHPHPQFEALLASGTTQFFKTVGIKEQKLFGEFIR